MKKWFRTEYVVESGKRLYLITESDDRNSIINGIKFWYPNSDFIIIQTIEITGEETKNWR